VRGVGGGELHVEVSGDGPPVLLVHGFPDSGRLWRNQVGPIVDAGFTAIVPDLRGMGRSERPEGVDAYRLTNVVGDLLAVLEAHGAERAHVIGHDWGAAASWLLAALQPERVVSLAALSVGHPNASRPSFLPLHHEAAPPRSEATEPHRATGRGRGGGPGDDREPECLEPTR
jgi:pimeloyl-ACP methyl ester carboxylesterase